MSDAVQSHVLSVTSFAAFQIILKFNEVELASGTAFFAGVGNRALLVTNKHNVLGRNIRTGECLDKKNVTVPNVMSVLIPITSQKDQGFICSTRQWYHIPLYNEVDNSPAWVEHPDPTVDVVGFKFRPPEITLKHLVLPADGLCKFVTGLTSLVIRLGFQPTISQFGALATRPLSPQLTLMVNP